MPPVIAWASWHTVYKEDKQEYVELIMNFFKAFCLLSFLYYVNSLLGWVQNDSKNEYSKDQVYESLCAGKEKTHYLCCRFKPIENHAKAKKYLFRVELFVAQFSIVLLVLALAGAVIIVANDGNTDPIKDNVSIFSLIKTASALFAFMGLGHLGMFVSKLPNMKDLQIMSKFLIIKVGILFTEAQPIFIEQIANAGLIADTSLYSEKTISIYTNALLTCSEAIILSFLLFLVFPLSDYDTYPHLKAPLITSNKEE